MRFSDRSKVPVIEEKTGETFNGLRITDNVKYNKYLRKDVIFPTLSGIEPVI